MKISFTLNGQSYERDVEGHRTLLHFIREDLGFTGAKEGCGAGECGACTILMDGEAVNACMVLAAEADGCEVTTIEGLAARWREKTGASGLHPVQESFLKLHAVQCGFCSPGMILSAAALLETNPAPTEADVRSALAGNLCRCTGYRQILDAVLDASRRLP